MLKQLVKIANELDEIGKYEESNIITQVLIKLAGRDKTAQSLWGGEPAQYRKEELTHRVDNAICPKCGYKEAIHKTFVKRMPHGQEKEIVIHCSNCGFKDIIDQWID